MRQEERLLMFERIFFVGFIVGLLCVLIWHEVDINNRYAKLRAEVIFINGLRVSSGTGAGSGSLLAAWGTEAVYSLKVKFVLIVNFMVRRIYRMNCEKCFYWKDFEVRVWAVISGKRGERGDGTIELRQCKYAPAPSSGEMRHIVYTDKEYSCSEWRELKS